MVPMLFKKLRNSHFRSIGFVLTKLQIDLSGTSSTGTTFADLLLGDDDGDDGDDGDDSDDDEDDESDEDDEDEDEDGDDDDDDGEKGSCKKTKEINTLSIKIQQLTKAGTSSQKD